MQKSTFVIHHDQRYQTVENLGEWDVRTVPDTDPSYDAFFRADCLPVQLFHLPTGLSILSASRRTCGKFEAMIPRGLLSKTLGSCPKKQHLVALRSDGYGDLRSAIYSEFGIVAPELREFRGYALTDRPGPDEPLPG